MSTFAPRPRSAACCALLLLTGCADIPAGLLGVATIDAALLGQQLDAGQRPVVLDVRAAEDFAAGHIPGATLVPLAEVEGFLATLPLGTSVVTVCYGGRLSLWAAAKAHGRVEVASLRGGMRAWRALGQPVEAGAQMAWSGPKPRQTLSLWLQTLVVVTAFGAKPLYMLLALGLVWLLRREREREVRLLWWAMLSFFVGESFCALNYLFADDGSVAFEALHMLGMAGQNALLPWALFELLDRRVLRFSDPSAGCAAVRFCGRCYKNAAVACGAQRLFLVIVPALMLVSTLPFCLPPHAGTCLATVLGTDVTYGVGLWVELLEFRLFPSVALVLFAVALAQLWRGEQHLRAAALPFFWGLGFAVFALLRFLLTRSFAERLAWADVWEELTELCVTLAVALGLWLFRQQLGLTRKAAPAVAEA